jgi:hypothetical protein
LRYILLITIFVIGFYLWNVGRRTRQDESKLPPGVRRVFKRRDGATIIDVDPEDRPD